MQKIINDQPNPQSRLFQKRSQVTRLCFLLPRIGLVLLACCITMIAVVPSAYGNIDKTSEAGKVNFDKNGENLAAVLERLSLSGLPKNADLIVHVHAKNTTSSSSADVCKGPVLFLIGKDKGLKTDAAGNIKFSGTIAFSRDTAANQDLFKRSLVNTWRLNVHDAGQPIDGGKFKSVACGLLATNGDATLKVA